MALLETWKASLYKSDKVRTPGANVPTEQVKPPPATPTAHIKVLVQVLTTSLPMPFSANTSGKAAGGTPTAAHREPEGNLDSWLQPGSVLQPALGHATMLFLLRCMEEDQAAPLKLAKMHNSSPRTRKQRTFHRTALPQTCQSRERQGKIMSWIRGNKET